MSKFTTRIDATGPSGNVNVVLASATRMLRQMMRAEVEIQRLERRVREAQSYDEALGYIREWFPVDTEKK